MQPAAPISSSSSVSHQQSHCITHMHSTAPITIIVIICNASTVTIYHSSSLNSAYINMNYVYRISRYVHGCQPVVCKYTQLERHHECYASTTTTTTAREEEDDVTTEIHIIINIIIIIIIIIIKIWCCITKYTSDNPRSSTLSIYPYQQYTTTH